ncbi:transferase family-domain-containing protein [Schizophyllum fasciatum]
MSETANLNEAYADVTVTGQQLVNCAHHEHVDAHLPVFQLGTFDHMTTPNFVVEVIFAYDALSAGGRKPISATRLHQALGRTLDYYPHLTGRQRANPETGKPDIGELGTGAAFHTATCSARLDVPRGVAGLPCSGKALLAPLRSEGPLLSLQYTRFACGGVTLGVCVQHVVCGAHGLSLFMRDLADIYRGIDAAEAEGGSYLDVSLQTPPCIRSYVPEETGRPYDAEDVIENYMAEPESDANGSEQAAEPETPFVPPGPVVWKVMRFSSEELRALKAHATDTTPDGEWVSTFEALSAHLWQSLHRARTQLYASAAYAGAVPTPPTADLITAVNCRARLALPARYFPNVSLCPHARLPLAALARAPLAHVARALHGVLRVVTPARVDGTLRHLAAGREYPVRYRNTPWSFMVSAWNKIDLYDACFAVDAAGKGIPPVLVTQPFDPTMQPLDGLAYLMPTGVVQGSQADAIDVGLALYKPTWAILEGDPHFRRFKE